jgi:alanyl-tRNA synthetase
MPADLIRDFAAERGGSLDERRFGELFDDHRALSRGAVAQPEHGGRAGSPDAEVITALGLAPTRFLGYEQITATGQVVALLGPHGLVETLVAGDSGLAVLDQTPFYAEGGGQVGDTGKITAPGLSARVTDTQAADGQHVHAVEITIGALSTGDTVELAVGAARRRSVMRNHSATHLLHGALRQVLGEHVRQAGSLVAPDRLRFDFLHPQALSDDETERVERLVNAEVLVNVERTTEIRPYQDAIREGAIAFFGDKYADDVRVVSFDGFSTELCGGTHVQRTAEVGLFLIVSEGSIGSGVRRIEAVTGEAAVQRALDRDKLLRGLATRLRVPVEQLPVRVEALTARTSKPRAARLDVEALAATVRLTSAGHRFVVVEDPDLAVADLASQARQLSRELDAVAVLLLPDTQQLRIGVSVPDALVPHIPATGLLDSVLAVTGGRGGGSATFAQGGGGQPADMPDVVAAVQEALETV